MAIKGKKRLTKTSRRRKISRRNRKTLYNKRRQCIRGGNYKNDATTRTTEGDPTKPLNEFVVTIPGYPAMSGTSYKRLMEDKDRNGSDYSD